MFGAKRSERYVTVIKVSQISVHSDVYWFCDYLGSPSLISLDLDFFWAFLPVYHFCIHSYFSSFAKISELGE